MNSVHDTSSNDDTRCLSLVQLLEAVPPGERGGLLQSAVSFRPGRTLDESFAVGPLRAAFADFWEAETGRPIEPAEVQKILEPPIPIRTVLAFSKLALAGVASELASELKRLVRYLQDKLVRHAAQLSMFEVDERPAHYLELYGREEVSDSAWTVYGNDVEPRFF